MRIGGEEGGGGVHLQYVWDFLLIDIRFFINQSQMGFWLSQLAYYVSILRMYSNVKFENSDSAVSVTVHRVISDTAEFKFVYCVDLCLSD